MRSVALAVALLACLPLSTYAQEPLPGSPIELKLWLPAPDTADKDRLEAMKLEILQWNKAAQKYEDYIAKYLNRRWVKYTYVRDRMPAPTPPSWLASECAFLDQSQFIFILDWQKANKAALGTRMFGDIDPFQQACIYLFDLENGVASIVAHQARATTAVREEEPPWIQFGMRVHLDLGYLPSTYPPPPVYGPLGLHLTVMNIFNRLEFFGPPGLMWVNMPDGVGSRKSEALWTWGMGLRTFDFTVPGTRERLSLNLNLIKAWSWEGYRGGKNMMGVSFSPAKKK